MSCWDTSALLKLYVQEADSSIFAQLAAARARIVISAIARYEAEAVFRRKEADGRFQREMRMFSSGNSMRMRGRAW